LYLDGFNHGGVPQLPDGIYDGPTETCTFLGPVGNECDLWLELTGTPVPEPASVVLAALPAMALRARAKGRGRNWNVKA
jgi:hypothetical protein